LLNTAADDNRRATCTNAQGQIVGYSAASDGSLHGFVWDKQQGMKDRNDLKQSGYADVIAIAADVNDFGVITSRPATDPVTGARKVFVARPACTVH
jgi:probable HAF family extracellular repeat protein